MRPQAFIAVNINAGYGGNGNRKAGFLVYALPDLNLVAFHNDNGAGPQEMRVRFPGCKVICETEVTSRYFKQCEALGARLDRQALSAEVPAAGGSTLPPAAAGMRIDQEDPQADPWFVTGFDGFGHTVTLATANDRETAETKFREAVTEYGERGPDIGPRYDPITLWNLHLVWGEARIVWGM